MTHKYVDTWIKDIIGELVRKSRVYAIPFPSLKNVRHVGLYINSLVRCYLLIAPCPLLPITKVCRGILFVASHIFSDGSPQ